MEPLSWNTVLLLVAAAVGAVVVAYLNNSKRLLARIDLLTEQQFKAQDQILMLHQDASDCKSREGDLKQLVASQGNRIRILETSAGQPPAAVLTSGIVVADLKGTIREFSSTLTPIFKYLPREVIGKPITILMPPEYVESAMAKFKLAVIDPDNIDQTQMLPLYALDKFSERKPILVNFRGWKVGTEGLITATIQDRPDTKPTNHGAGDSGVLKRGDAV